jgi:Replication-relaxation
MSAPGRLAVRVVEENRDHLVDASLALKSCPDSFTNSLVLEKLSSADGTPSGKKPSLALVRSDLAKRDLEVLRSVASFRYMTARQIEDLHFQGHASRLTGARTARRVLDRLTSADVLTRLDRRIGGVRAGSASFVYAVGPVGRRLLPEESSVIRRFKEPSKHFLNHTLAIAELAVELQMKAKGSEMVSGKVGCEVGSPGISSSIELLELVTEPECWRDFKTETLKPDLVVVLASSEYEHHWFVEVDLGTESSVAVVRKANCYLTYFKTGQEQKARGVFPKVLFVVPDSKGAELLTSRLARLEPKLFSVVVRSQAVETLSHGGQK